MDDEPQEDPYASLTGDALEEALKAAQERTRRVHAEEDARDAERLTGPLASILDVVPTAEEIQRRADEARKEAEERERRRIEREPELRRIKAESWEERCRAHHGRFAQATLDSIERVNRQQIERWITDPSPGTLLFLGGVGTGKTFGAFAVMREMFLGGHTVKFWPVPKLLDALRPNSGFTEAVAMEAATVDVLVLDDLGSERPTDWSMERLYILMNDRWMAERRLIATSNLDQAALLKAIGERMFSRLIDGAYACNFGMEDRRKPR